MKKEFLSKQDLETQNIGEEFSNNLIAGDVIALNGELGSGKTQFVKGICNGLKITEHVTSPTFTLVSEYLHGKLPIYHFDFYRINSEKELEEIGFDSYLESDGVLLIEWADKISQSLPKKRYEINFKYGSTQNERIISIEKI